MSLTTSSGPPLLRPHNIEAILVDTSAESRRRILDSIRESCGPWMTAW